MLVHVTCTFDVSISWEGSHITNEACKEPFEAELKL